MTGLVAFLRVWAFELRVFARQVFGSALAGCGGFIVLVGLCAGIVTRVNVARVEVVVEDPSVRASLELAGEHERELRRTSWRDAPSGQADAVVWVPADPLGDPWRVDAADPASAADGRARALELQGALRREALGPPDPEAKDQAEPPGFAAGLLCGVGLVIVGATLSWAIRSKHGNTHVALALGLPRRAVWFARRQDLVTIGLGPVGYAGCVAAVFSAPGGGFTLSCLAALVLGVAGDAGLAHLPDGVARRFLPAALGIGGLLALLTPTSAIPAWGLVPGVGPFAVGFDEHLAGPMGLLHGALALAALWVVAGLEPGGDGSGGIA